jgi:nucleotide-binding universal stress UspA family protein
MAKGTNFARQTTEQAVQTTNWMRAIAEQNLNQSKAAFESLLTIARNAASGVPRRSGGIEDGRFFHQRRSYEAGHSPKFMVVIDDSPECDRALYFASRRALRVGATVLMLRVIETRDRNQHWLGVADIMRAEAHEEANAVLDRHAARSSRIAGVMPQRVIREGDKAQEVLNLIEDDEDIAALVLAAATSKEGPGPLVSSLAKNAGDFPIPVAIVPGHLSDEELDALS